MSDYDVVIVGARPAGAATGMLLARAGLRVPAIGADGEIRQRRGVTSVQGLYIVGQRFQHYRDAGPPPRNSLRRFGHGPLG